MEHYVTIINSLFLPQATCLQRSMVRHAGPFTLWVICVDELAFKTLTKLQLNGVKPLLLTTLETKELKQIRPTRTEGEYCWTLTPFAPAFVFDQSDSVARVTYIDADMWFLKNPAPVFREFENSRKNVLITDHAYAPEYDQSAQYGQYCVQFMTFNRGASEKVRKWWQDRCVEWCFNRCEDGKFGDQKYLDDWPSRFEKYVHILCNKELMLAPWNATRFPYGNACLWHFHGLRLIEVFNTQREFVVGPYKLPEPCKRYVYENYISELISVIAEIEKTGLELEAQVKTSRWKLIQEGQAVASFGVKWFPDSV